MIDPSQEQWLRLLAHGKGHAVRHLEVDATVDVERSKGEFIDDLDTREVTQLAEVLKVLIQAVCHLVNRTVRLQVLSS